MKHQKHHMKTALLFLVGTFILLSITSAQDLQKPRLIVITDIGTEPDDIQSFVRLLTYSNEFDIEGFIASTSKHMRDRVHPEYMDKRIEAYGEVLDMLKVHTDGYPSPEYLKSVVRSADPVFGMKGVGKGYHKEAAQLIIDAVDKDDPRPVWVTVWGGAAPLAQALWQVKDTRTTEELEAFVDKLRVYTISDQDDASVWARMMFPKLFWITSLHAMTEYQLASWPGIMMDSAIADPDKISNQWLNENIRSKGPLGATYPLPIYGVEGDTPSFLHLIPNGLGNPERPDWGSWGGRYRKMADFLGVWTDSIDQVTAPDGTIVSGNKVTVARWRDAFQNDFAARMQWTVSENYAAANHNPIPILNETEGQEPLIIKACPGEEVSLSAEGTKDPDGDELTLRWFWYNEAGGLYSPSLKLSNETGKTTEVTVPRWKQATALELPEFIEFHVILEVTDDGTPQLTRYRRAVIKIITQGGVSDSGT